MKTKPVVLDRWESQLIWYAKHWLTDKDGNSIDISMVDALKNLWANRCGMELKYIGIENLVVPLLGLLIKLNLFKNLDNALTLIVEGCAPQGRWTKEPLQYTDNKGYYERVCWVCLYNFLSSVQVFKDAEQKEPIFILLPFEPDLLLKNQYDEEDEKEDIS